MFEIKKIYFETIKNLPSHLFKGGKSARAKCFQKMCKRRCLLFCIFFKGIWEIIFVQIKEFRVSFEMNLNLLFHAIGLFGPLDLWTKGPKCEPAKLKKIIINKRG